MNYINDPKYFGTAIVFCSLCKILFIFADSHVLPDTKLGRRDSNTQPLGLQQTPFFEAVCMGHTRRHHVCSRVSRVIVSLDQFRQNIYIFLRISERKIYSQSIYDRPVGTFHDRTFQIAISANLKQNALIMS
jgi:hypothetical protein